MTEPLSNTTPPAPGDQVKIWRLTYRQAHTGYRVTQYFPTKEAAKASRVVSVISGNKILSLKEVTVTCP